MLERIDRRVSQALASQNRILKTADRAWLTAEKAVGRAFTYLFGHVPIRGLLEAQAGNLGIKSVSPSILMSAPADAGGGSLMVGGEILPGVKLPLVSPDTIANCKKAIEEGLDEHQRVHADFQAASGKIDQARFKWLRTIIVSTATAVISAFAFPFVGAIGLSLSAPLWAPFVISGLEFFATAFGLQGAVYVIRYGIRKYAYNKKDTALINCESRIYEFMSEPLYKEVLAATLFNRQQAGKDTSNIIDLFTGEEKEGLVAIVNAYKAFGTLTQESNSENLRLAKAARDKIPAGYAIRMALDNLIAAAEPSAPPRTEPLPPPRPPVATAPYPPAPDYVAPPPGVAVAPPVVTLSPLRPAAEPPAPPRPRAPEPIRIILGKTYPVVSDLVRLKEATEDLAQLIRFSATTEFPRLPADDQTKINHKMDVLVKGAILPMQEALGLVLTGKDASGKEVKFIIDAAEKPNGSQLVPNGIFIGRGGMAEVYRGVEAKSRIPIAVKIITDPDSDKRAELEAFAPQAIKNPHVIEIYAFGKTTFGRSFIAMELFGKSLAEVLNEGTKVFKDDEAVKAVLQILDGLKAAHEKLIYHRDLKPANVFVRQETKPDGKKSDVMALADWGMVKSFQEDLSSSLAGLTKGLEMRGTPSYTPPENAYFKSLDMVEVLSKTEPPDSILSRNGWLSRVDIYAVGCILYELINRHDPIKIDSLETLLGTYSIKIPTDLFNAARAISKQNSGEELSPDERRLLNSLPANIERWKAEVANQIAENRARIAGEKKFKIDRGIIHEHLFPIVEKMLAYDPQRRYAKVEDVIRDLEKFLRGEPLVPEAVSKKTVHLGPAATSPSAPARSVVGGHSIKILFEGDEAAFRQDLDDIFNGTDPSKVTEALRDPEATRQRILAKNRSLPYDPERDALANDVIGMLFSLKK